MKKALVIIGDAWHAIGPLSSTIVKRLQDQYEVDVILDEQVPFSELYTYDLIMMSKYGNDDVKVFKEFKDTYGSEFWLTADQEIAIENYVMAGGKLFFHHDGFVYYRKGGGISKLAKAYFYEHPPIGPIEVRPVKGFEELNEGIEAYVINDEEYHVAMDESETNVFLESYSEANGRHPQGWYHKYGKGQVAVFIPGHDMSVLSHEMVAKSIDHVIRMLAE